MKASRARARSSRVKLPSSKRMPAACISPISAPRVQPGRMCWSRRRVRMAPASSTIQKLVAAPSMTSFVPGSKRMASEAPCSFAACRASTLGSRFTVLMSGRAQRSSGAVMAFRFQPSMLAG